MSKITNEILENNLKYLRFKIDCVEGKYIPREDFDCLFKSIFDKLNEIKNKKEYLLIKGFLQSALKDYIKKAAY